MELGERGLDADHWRVANSRGQLGLALAARGRVDEARREMEHALAVLTENLGPDHERTQRVIGYLEELSD